MQYRKHLDKYHDAMQERRDRAKQYEWYRDPVKNVLVFGDAKREVREPDASGASVRYASVGSRDAAPSHEGIQDHKATQTIVYGFGMPDCGMPDVAHNVSVDEVLKRNVERCEERYQ